MHITMRKPALLAAAAATVAVASAASAQVTLDLGDIFVDDNASLGDIPLALPAGTYTSYSFYTEWSPAAGGPWSSEAIWAVTDGPLDDPSTTFYEDPGSSPDSQFSSDPVTLTWQGFFDIPVVSTGALNEFFLLTLQSFTGSSANWNNTTFTLGFETLQPPPAQQAFLSSSGVHSQALAAGEVLWFQFDYDGTSDFAIDTLGSDLQPDNDTELGLYNSAGSLVMTNDDAGSFLSSLVVPGGLLEEGTYYLAVGAYNTVFGDEFNATSSSENSGQVTLRGIVIPEPGSLAVAGVGGLLLLRRRRN